LKDDQVVLRPLERYHNELESLSIIALLEAVRNVSLLAEDFKANNIPKDGATLILGAWKGRSLVGVGGRTWCPHVSSALRMRRFFVAPIARRQGIARAMVSLLLADASKYCSRITCNARATPFAPLFWESLGFIATDVPGITHSFKLTSGQR
jgi:GNAT superfamily N-acetyltransferase